MLRVICSINIAELNTLFLQLEMRKVNFSLITFQCMVIVFLLVIMILYIVGESSLYAKNESFARALLQWNRAASQGMSFGMQRLFMLSSSERTASTLQRVCSFI